MNQEIRISSLETLRLRLRPMDANDAEQLTRLLRDPEISKWTNSIPFPYSLDDAKSYLATQKPTDGLPTSFVWGMVEKHSNTLMGTMGFHDLHFERGRAELGYWIGKDFRGHGYTSEAARRVLSWAFEDAEFDRIQATYMPGNEASAAVMRNIGMQEEGLLRGYGFKNGQHFDICLRAVLRSDSTWMSTSDQMGKS